MKKLICPTCLSLDRKHFPLDITKYGSLFGDKIMKNVDSVCWECINLFHKVYKFKQQVVRAQEYLTNTEKKLKTLTPLIYLTCSTIKVNDICCNVSLEGINNHLLLKNDLIQNIKSEPLCEEMNNDSEYRYEVSINIIKTDENDATPDKDIDHSHIKNENYTYEMISDDTTLKKLPVKNVKIEKARKKTPIKRKAKIKVEKNKVKNDSNTDKLMITKDNYTIINMTEDEMLAKREADRQTDRYKNKVKYRCELCILGFFNKNMYEKHLLCKHSEKAGTHQCPICEVRFNRVKFFKEHVQSHYRKYKCRICPFTDYKLSKMASHDAKEHDVKRFICKLCSEEFSSSSNLRFHRERTHQPPPKCEYCGKIFTSKNGLRVHVLQKHKHVPKTQCTLCGDYVHYLNNHMRKHRAAPESAYCAECDLKFTSSSCYNAHLKYAIKHRKDTVLRHVCKICNAKFVTATFLKKHTMARHSTERPLKCDRCGKGFTARSRLNEHILHVHEGVQKPKNNICHICEKGFNTKFMLSNHIRIHTGEKPFRCDICSAAFSQKSSLTTHTRGVHLKLKPRPGSRHTSNPID